MLFRSLRIVDTNAYFIAFIGIILQNIQWREIRSHHHLTSSPRLVPGQTGVRKGAREGDDGEGAQDVSCLKLRYVFCFLFIYIYLILFINYINR